MEYDFDRVLKNENSNNIEDFIRKNYLQFSDGQLLKALNLMYRGEGTHYYED